MTEVWKIFTPERKGQHKILEGTLEEMSKELCKALKEDMLL